MGPPFVYVTMINQAKRWTEIVLCLDSPQIIPPQEGFVNLGGSYVEPSSRTDVPLTALSRSDMMEARCSSTQRLLA